MDSQLILNRREKSRYNLMYQNLLRQFSELKELAQEDKEFGTLANIVNQRQLKIDKIQTFTYISLSKRLADHSYFHCCICDETFTSAQQLLQHRFPLLSYHLMPPTPILHLAL